MIYQRALRNEIVHKRPCSHLDLAPRHEESLPDRRTRRIPPATQRAPPRRHRPLGLHAPRRTGAERDHAPALVRHRPRTGLLHIRRAIDRQDRLKQTPKTKVVERRVPLTNDATAPARGPPRGKKDSTHDLSRTGLTPGARTHNEKVTMARFSLLRTPRSHGSRHRPIRPIPNHDHTHDADERT